MNKEMFLEELQGYLEILEDQEQQDILQEYTQHIDIKIQNGQNEEAAIRDFGPVKELAAEILEAYHVKPEFGEGRRKKGLPGLSGRSLENGEKKLFALGRFLKRKGAAFFRAAGRLCARAAGGLRKLWHLVTRPIRRGREPKEALELRQESTGGMKMELAGERTADMGKGVYAAQTPGAGSAGAFKGVSGFFRSFGRGILRLIRWALRLIWNCFWILCAAGTGIFAVMALFGFGTVLILLMQGYPLLGVLLVCLGAFLSGGAAALGCLSLIRRQRRERDSRETKTWENADGEEAEWIEEEEEAGEIEEMETEPDDTDRQGGAQ